MPVSMAPLDQFEMHPENAVVEVGSDQLRLSMALVMHFTRREEAPVV